jgi:hypothetical protein
MYSIRASLIPDAGQGTQAEILPQWGLDADGMLKTFKTGLPK